MNKTGKTILKITKFIMDLFSPESSFQKDNKGNEEEKVETIEN